MVIINYKLMLAINIHLFPFSVPKYVLLLSKI